MPCFDLDFERNSSPLSVQLSVQMAQPIFPAEFDTACLRLGTRRLFHGRQDDWSMELFYNDLPLRIETPWMANVFGQSAYEQQNGRGTKAYSLSFALADDSEVADFHKFLFEFESWFQTQLQAMGIKKPFYSSIRPAKDPKYAPTLRCKLKTKFGRFDCKLYIGEEEKKWAIASGTEPEVEVNHGDRCRAIIQLQPIWCAGGRVGISWKAVSIQKDSVAAFRVPEPQDQTKPFGRDTNPEFMPEPMFRPLANGTTAKTSTTLMPRPPTPRLNPNAKTFEMPDRIVGLE